MTSRSISNPKTLNPRCLNCRHLWSRHFVNDPEPGCNVTVFNNRTGVRFCGCTSFRAGCANCNHPMSDHGSIVPGPCHNCRCDQYEHSA